MSKKVLITGGNSGIGYATAELLKKKGYGVIIAGRHQSKVKEAATTLGVEYAIADMTNLDALQTLAERFRDTGLDVVINSAAMANFLPIQQISPHDYTLFFETNFRGPIELIRLLLPALEKRAGAVINISSIAVSKGLINGSLYAATKGALEAATRSLALELAPKKIRVNVVAPGAIDTPLAVKTGRNKEELAQRRTALEQSIPLRRYGKPEEVAHVISAQIEASYVTGSIWFVDGGAHLV